MSSTTLSHMTISPSHAVGAWFRDMAAKWRRRALDRATLAHLEDRDLHDLGLSRAAAEYEVSKPFWRD